MGLAISQVQNSMSLATMLDPKQLGLIVSHTQGLATTLDSKHLDLTVIHAQGDMGPTNMSNPKHLDSTITKFSGYHSY